jgi:[ribosomal protein S18]-alanine N-acetyltransferase
VNASLGAKAWHFAPIAQAQLPQLLAIEQRAYSHPWSEANFSDSLASGYRIQGLWHAASLAGYSVVMRGVDESHLLNLTVAPEHQGQGMAQALLAELCAWSLNSGLGWLWLEVRASNAKAIRAYQRFGLQQVGQRKGYYPLNRLEREDAIVMSLELSRVAIGERTEKAAA